MTGFKTKKIIPTWKSYLSQIVLFSLLIQMFPLSVAAEEFIKYDKEIITDEIDQLSSIKPELVEKNKSKRDKALDLKKSEKKNWGEKRIIERLKNGYVESVIDNRESTQSLVADLKEDGVLQTIISADGDEIEINPSLSKKFAADEIKTKKAPYEASLPVEFSADNSIKIIENKDIAGQIISAKEDKIVSKDLTPETKESISYFNRNASESDVVFEDNKAIYKNIWQATDLLVTTSAEGVKEDIILKNSLAPTNFDYVIETVGLELVFKEDGGFAFIDSSGQEKFYTPAPDITDVSGNYETDSVSFRSGWGDLNNSTITHENTELDMNDEEKNSQSQVEDNSVIGGKYVDLQSEIEDIEALELHELETSKKASEINDLDDSKSDESSKDTVEDAHQLNKEINLSDDSVEIKNNLDNSSIKNGSEMPIQKDQQREVDVGGSSDNFENKNNENEDEVGKSSQEIQDQKNIKDNDELGLVSFFKNIGSTILPPAVAQEVNELAEIIEEQDEDVTHDIGQGVEDTENHDPNLDELVLVPDEPSEDLGLSLENKEDLLNQDGVSNSNDEPDLEPKQAQEPQKSDNIKAEDEDPPQKTEGEPKEEIESLPQKIEDNSNGKNEIIPPQENSKIEKNNTENDSEDSEVVDQSENSKKPESINKKEVEIKKINLDLENATTPKQEMTFSEFSDSSEIFQVIKNSENEVIRRYKIRLKIDVAREQNDVDFLDLKNGVRLKYPLDVDPSTFVSMTSRGHRFFSSDFSKGNLFGVNTHSNGGGFVAKENYTPPPKKNSIDPSIRLYQDLHAFKQAENFKTFEINGEYFLFVSDYYNQHNQYNDHRYEFKNALYKWDGFGFVPSGLDMTTKKITDLKHFKDEKTGDDYIIYTTLGDDICEIRYFRFDGSEIVSGKGGDFSVPILGYQNVSLNIVKENEDIFLIPELHTSGNGGYFSVYNWNSDASKFEVHQQILEQKGITKIESFSVDDVSYLYTVLDYYDKIKVYKFENEKFELFQELAEKTGVTLDSARAEITEIEGKTYLFINAGSAAPASFYKWRKKGFEYDFSLDWRTPATVETFEYFGETYLFATGGASENQNLDESSSAAVLYRWNGVDFDEISTLVSHGSRYEKNIHSQKIGDEVFIFIGNNTEPRNHKVGMNGGIYRLSRPIFEEYQILDSLDNVYFWRKMAIGGENYILAITGHEGKIFKWDNPSKKFQFFQDLESSKYLGDAFEINGEYFIVLGGHNGGSTSIYKWSGSKFEKTGSVDHAGAGSTKKIQFISSESGDYLLFVNYYEESGDPYPEVLKWDGSEFVHHRSLNSRRAHSAAVFSHEIGGSQKNLILATETGNNTCYKINNNFDQNSFCRTSESSRKNTLFNENNELFMISGAGTALKPYKYIPAQNSFQVFDLSNRRLGISSTGSGYINCYLGEINSFSLEGETYISTGCSSSDENAEIWKWSGNRMLNIQELKRKNQKSATANDVLALEIDGETYSIAGDSVYKKISTPSQEVKSTRLMLKSEKTLKISDLHGSFVSDPRDSDYWDFRDDDVLSTNLSKFEIELKPDKSFSELWADIVFGPEERLIEVFIDGALINTIKADSAFSVKKSVMLATGLTDSSHEILLKISRNNPQFLIDDSVEKFEISHLDLYSAGYEVYMKSKIGIVGDDPSKTTINVHLPQNEDHLSGYALTFTTGEQSGKTVYVIDHNQSTNQITFSPELTSPPSRGDVYQLTPNGMMINDRAEKGFYLSKNNDFSVSLDYDSVSNDTLTSGSGTWSTWVKIGEDSDQISKNLYIFDLGDKKLFYSGIDKKFHFQIFDSENNIHEVESEETIFSGQAHLFLSVSWDSSSGLKMFVNQEKFSKSGFFDLNSEKANNCEISSELNFKSEDFQEIERFSISGAKSSKFVKLENEEILLIPSGNKVILKNLTNNEEEALSLYSDRMETFSIDGVEHLASLSSHGNSNNKIYTLNKNSLEFKESIENPSIVTDFKFFEIDKAKYLVYANRYGDSQYRQLKVRKWDATENKWRHGVYHSDFDGDDLVDSLEAFEFENENYIAAAINGGAFPSKILKWDGNRHSPGFLDYQSIDGVFKLVREFRYAEDQYLVFAGSSGVDIYRFNRVSKQFEKVFSDTNMDGAAHISDIEVIKDRDETYLFFSNTQSAKINFYKFNGSKLELAEGVLSKANIKDLESFKKDGENHLIHTNYSAGEVVVNKISRQSEKIDFSITDLQIFDYVLTDFEIFKLRNHKSPSAHQSHNNIFTELDRNNAENNLLFHQSFAGDFSPEFGVKSGGMIVSGYDSEKIIDQSGWDSYKTKGNNGLNSVVSTAESSKISSSDGILAYFEMENNFSNSITSGISGVPHDISFVDGIKGKSAYFSGDGGYFEIPHSEEINFSNKFTISLLLKKEDSNRGDLFNKLSDSNEGYSIRTNHISGESRAGIFINPTEGNLEKFDTEIPIINNSEWEHLVFIFDGKTVKMYKNGVLRSESKNQKIIGQNNKSLIIGAYLNDAGVPLSESFFKGKIDEIAIWGRALSHDEVADIVFDSSEKIIATTSTDVTEVILGADTCPDCGVLKVIIDKGSSREKQVYVDTYSGDYRKDQKFFIATGLESDTHKITIENAEFKSGNSYGNLVIPKFIATRSSPKFTSESITLNERIVDNILSQNEFYNDKDLIFNNALGLNNKSGSIEFFTKGDPLSEGDIFSSLGDSGKNGISISVSEEGPIFKLKNNDSEISSSISISDYIEPEINHFIFSWDQVSRDKIKLGFYLNGIKRLEEIRDFSLNGHSKISFGKSSAKIFNFSIWSKYFNDLNAKINNDPIIGSEVFNHFKTRAHFVEQIKQKSILNKSNGVNTHFTLSNGLLLSEYDQDIVPDDIRVYVNGEKSKVSNIKSGIFTTIKEVSSSSGEIILDSGHEASQVSDSGLAYIGSGNSREIVVYSAYDAEKNTLILSKRGVDGTSATSWPAGTSIEICGGFSFVAPPKKDDSIFVSYLFSGTAFDINKGNKFGKGYVENMGYSGWITDADGVHTSKSGQSITSFFRGTQISVVVQESDIDASEEIIVLIDEGTINFREFRVDLANLRNGNNVKEIASNLTDGLHTVRVINNDSGKLKIVGFIANGATPLLEFSSGKVEYEDPIIDLIPEKIPENIIQDSIDFDSGESFVGIDFWKTEFNQISNFKVIAKTKNSVSVDSEKIEVTDDEGLPNSGFVKIKEEVIFYGSKTTYENSVFLENLSRGIGESRIQSSSEGESVKVIGSLIGLDSGDWRSNTKSSWHKTFGKIPENAYILAGKKGIQIIDAITNSVWMRARAGYGNAINSEVTGVSSASGSVFAATRNGIIRFDFQNDKIEKIVGSETYSAKNEVKDLNSFADINSGNFFYQSDLQNLLSEQREDHHGLFLKEVQSIRDQNIRGHHHFEINGENYMVTYEAKNNGRFLYKWDGQKFEKLKEIQLSGSYPFVSFEEGGEFYLIAGTKVGKWNGGDFVETGVVGDYGCEKIVKTSDSTYCTFKRRDYVYLHKWNGSGFDRLDYEGLSDLVDYDAFEIDNQVYIAATTDNTSVRSYLYHWNGSSLRDTALGTKSAQHRAVHFFEKDGGRYLAILRNSDLRIRKWDGSSFNNYIQAFRPRGSYINSFSTFEKNGELYLKYSVGSSDEGMYFLKWNGSGFDEEPVLKLIDFAGYSGASNSEFIKIGNSLYMSDTSNMEKINNTGANYNLYLYEIVDRLDHELIEEEKIIENNHYYYHETYLFEGNRFFAAAGSNEPTLVFRDSGEGFQQVDSLSDGSVRDIEMIEFGGELFLIAGSNSKLYAYKYNGVDFDLVSQKDTYEVLKTLVFVEDDELYVLSPSSSGSNRSWLMKWNGSEFVVTKTNVPHNNARAANIIRSNGELRLISAKTGQDDQLLFHRWNGNGFTSYIQKTIRSASFGLLSSVYIDGKAYVFAKGSYGGATLFEVDSGREVQDLQLFLPNNGSELINVFEKDGVTYLISAADDPDGVLQVWKWSGDIFELWGTFDIGSTIYSIEVFEDGDEIKIITKNSEGGISLYDFSEVKEVKNAVNPDLIANITFDHWDDEMAISKKSSISIGNEAHDIESFSIDGDDYIAISQGSGGAKIYKWSSELLEHKQTLSSYGSGARDIEFFEMNGEFYLAQASWSTKSQIFKWNGELFEKTQDINSNYAYDIESFDFNGLKYLVVANNSGVAELFGWNNSQFEYKRNFSASGVKDWESFVVGEKNYLAASLSNKIEIYHIYGGSIPSVSKKQAITGVYPYDSDLFFIDDALYLAASNSSGTSRVYKWVDESFSLENQSELMSNSKSVRSFEFADVRYLVLTPTSSGKNSSIYAWDGNKFSEVFAGYLGKGVSTAVLKQGKGNYLLVAEPGSGSGINVFEIKNGRKFLNSANPNYGIKNPLIGSSSANGVSSFSLSADSNSVLEVEGTNSVNLSGGFSAGIWMKPDIDHADWNKEGYSVLISKGNKTFTGNDSFFSFIDSQNKIQFYVVEESGKYIHAVSAEPIKNIKKWHHLVLVYDGGESGNSLSVYMDGSLLPMAKSKVGSFSGNVHSGDYLIKIAQSEDGKGAFIGLVDEFFLKRKSISGSDVKKIFETQKNMLTSAYTTNIDGENNYLSFSLKNEEDDSFSLNILDLKNNQQIFSSAINSNLIAMEFGEDNRLYGSTSSEIMSISREGPGSQFSIESKVNLSDINNEAQAIKDLSFYEDSILLAVNKGIERISKDKLSRIDDKIFLAESGGENNILPVSLEGPELVSYNSASGKIVVSAKKSPGNTGFASVISASDASSPLIINEETESFNEKITPGQLSQIKDISFVDSLNQKRYSGFGVIGVGAVDLLLDSSANKVATKFLSQPTQLRDGSGMIELRLKLESVLLSQVKLKLEYSTDGINWNKGFVDNESASNNGNPVLVGNSDTFQLADINLSNGVSEVYLRWDSAEDLPNTFRENIRIRVVALGNDFQDSVVSSGFSIDNLKPVIINNQSGDDTWRRTAGIKYDVDFLDQNEVLFEYAIGSASGLKNLKNWTEISSGNKSGDMDFEIDFDSALDGVNNLVQIRATDLFGNKNILGDAFYLKKDTIPPVVDLVTSAKGSVSSNQILPFTFTPPSDASSGVELFEICIDRDKSNPCDHRASLALNATTYSEFKTAIWGQKYFAKIIATDVAGNQSESSWSSGVTPDGNNPVVSADKSGSQWYKENQVITLSTSDAESGLTQSRWSWSNDLSADCRSGGANFVNSETITLSSEGEKTLYLCAVDNAGNTAAWSGSYKIDKTMPVVEDSALVSPNGGENWNGGAIYEITWDKNKITDAISGLKTSPIAIEYSIDNVNWIEVATSQPNSGSYSWKIPDINSSNVRVRITAEDAAGLSSFCLSNSSFSITKSNNWKILEIISGQNQVAGMNENVKDELVVRVGNGAGSFAKSGDVEVSFSITESPISPAASGQVLKTGVFGQNKLGNNTENMTVETDASGKASVKIKLGNRAGDYFVTAKFDDGSGEKTQVFKITEREIFEVRVSQTKAGLTVDPAINADDSEAISVNVRTNAASWRIKAVPNQWLRDGSKEIKNWNGSTGFGWKNDSTQLETIGFDDSLNLPSQTVVLECDGEGCQGEVNSIISLFSAIDYRTASGNYSNSIKITGSSINF